MDLDHELGGPELVLMKLAAAFGSGGGADSSLEQAFKEADKDGSGFLDSAELCTVIKVSGVL